MYKKTYQKHTLEEALSKAAAHCSQSEQCVNDIMEKLIRWGMTEEEQTEIITRLCKENYIDEKRYCKSFVNDKLRFNHWGRIKITSKLKEKKLPQELISEALSTIDDKEYSEILYSLLTNKRKEIKDTDIRKNNQKLLRFAASRGFEVPMILKLINIDTDEMDF